ncbi:MAG: hypothetical protein V3U74_02635 [Thermodesulfobacteriota bacterium]
MAVQKETKVDEFTEAFKDFSGLVKDNYLLSLKTAVSLMEENQKLLNTQFDYLLSIQKEGADGLKVAYDKLPKELNAEQFSANLDNILNAQNNFVGVLRRASDVATKNSLAITQKTAERAIGVFEGYLKLFNV